MSRSATPAAVSTWTLYAVIPVPPVVAGAVHVTVSEPDARVTPVIVGAHEAGPLIRSKDGFWLAIPLEAAGKSRSGKRPTPGEWEARTGLRLIFVYRRTGPSLLVAEARLTKHGRAAVSRSRTGRGLASVPIFLLVPQVRLKKRLDLEKPANAALASLPGAIVSRWERT